MSIFERVSKTAIQNILGVVITVGVFILLYLMIIKEIPEKNKDVVLTAVGFVFGSGFGAVAGFFFGSSKVVNESKP
jgi:hypothetical protein